MLRGHETRGRGLAGAKSRAGQGRNKEGAACIAGARERASACAVCTAARQLLGSIRQGAGSTGQALWGVATRQIKKRADQCLSAPIATQSGPRNNTGTAPQLAVS